MRLFSFLFRNQAKNFDNLYSKLSKQMEKRNSFLGPNCAQILNTLKKIIPLAQNENKEQLETLLNRNIQLFENTNKTSSCFANLFWNKTFTPSSTLFMKYTKNLALEYLHDEIKGDFLKQTNPTGKVAHELGSTRLFITNQETALKLSSNIKNPYVIESEEKGQVLLNPPQNTSLVFIKKGTIRLEADIITTPTIIVVYPGATIHLAVPGLLTEPLTADNCPTNIRYIQL